MFSKNTLNFNFLTVCEILFKLKFSKFNQNISTQDVFGKFLLIVKNINKYFLGCEKYALFQRRSCRAEVLFKCISSALSKHRLRV